MNSDAPILRLELRGMGAAITTAFMQHASETQSFVERIVKEEVERFDFDAEVRKHVVPALRKAIERSVEGAVMYGEGRASIDAIVEKIVGAVK